MVTVTGALEAHLVTPATVFAVQTEAVLEGRALQNANGESCGGTLVESFAASCNSVFAPLGARLGARRLVDVAQRYGFNEPPMIIGAATSSIPPASRIGDALAVGSSAIGQGQVQATALQMASIAATIGEHGVRARPTLLAGQPRQTVRATSAAVARTVERLMIAVVTGGTGTAAAIPGVVVAGKTGTAELQNTVVTPGQPPPPNSTSTDAWFAANAPAGHPRVAVGVMLVKAGAGGQAAAPVAREVLMAALHRA
jgi:cell division protein FtsI/penicillin-binding protein 2